MRTKVRATTYDTAFDKMKHYNNTEQTLVSVIMPSYNTERYVAEAIESVLNQTYDNWELLAVDDGSTDRTGQIIDEYAQNDIRIRVIHTANNGVSHARNMGLDMATGEWVVFLDSDDSLPTDALSALMNNSEGCDIVIGNYCASPIDIQWYQITNDMVYQNFKELAPFFKDSFLQGLFNSCTRKLFDKKILDNRFRLDDKYGGDMLFFSELAGHLGSIHLITTVVYNYRTGNNNSMSHQFHYLDMVACEAIANNYIEIFDNNEITSLMHAFYLQALVAYFNIIFNYYSLDDNEKRKRVITTLNNSQLIKSIPLRAYPLKSKDKRKASIILIGDIEMIMEEFNINKCKAFMWSPSNEA